MVAANISTSIRFNKNLRFPLLGICIRTETQILLFDHHEARTNAAESSWGITFPDGHVKRDCYVQLKWLIHKDLQTVISSDVKFWRIWNTFNLSDHYFIRFHAHFPLTRFAGAAARARMEIPHGFPQIQTVLLAPHQDGPKQGPKLLFTFNFIDFHSLLSCRHHNKGLEQVVFNLFCTATQYSNQCFL